MRAFNKYPDYFTTESSVYGTGVGLSTKENYSLSGNLPTAVYSWNSPFKFSNPDAEMILEFTDKLKDLRDEYKRLLLECETAIFNLHTVEKVKAHFPEVIPYLPETAQNTAVAVDLKNLRCTLNPSVCT